MRCIRIRRRVYKNTSIIYSRSNRGRMLKEFSEKYLKKNYWVVSQKEAFGLKETCLKSFIKIICLVKINIRKRYRNTT